VNGQPLPTWDQLEPHVPVMTVTMRRYLDQIDCVLRPSSVLATGIGLRMFAAFIVTDHPDITAVAQLRRAHIEDYKRWLLARDSGRPQARLTPTTRSARLGALRMFFLRIIEWDWDDAPARPLVFLGDMPVRDRPLPKALDDTDAAKFLRAAQNQNRLLRRVVAEVLLRTGLRVSELCALPGDAIRTGTDGFWLYVPVGKLHNDRYLPLHPTLVGLIGDYRTRHVTADHPLLIPNEKGTPLNRAAVNRMLNRIAADAGIGHVHPHKLRHTLATQAINRGMSLEAIAAMLGHRSLDMTLKYARIADRTIADAYFDVADKVDALYDSHPPVMALTDLERETHSRLLGNGYCTRPRQLDCAHDTACENCVYFQTTIGFRPTLQAQHDDARDKNQPDRQQLFNELLSRIDNTAAS
jgi:site-specific recombinase XerD